MPTTAKQPGSPAAAKTGRVTQIIGSTFDVQFPEHHLPAIYNAVKISSQHKGITLNLTGEVQQHLGGGRVRCVALGNTDGMVRGMDCLDTGSPVKVPVGKCTLGRVFNLTGERDRRPRADRGRGLLAHPPRRPAGDRPFDPDRNLRDRHQGDRPLDAVRPRRQGGPVRRGRTGQDRDPDRTDRPDRLGPRRLLRLRRRRRADPRGQRPLAGNAEGQDRQHRPARDRPDVHGLRPDERAAGGPVARGPLGPDDGRILPRHHRRRRAAVHRQHLPFLAGRQRSLGPAGPDALGRGLSADAGHRDGPVAGADRLDQQGGDHLGAGGVRAGRRSDRPRPRRRLRPTRRLHLPGAVDQREGHLSGRRSAGQFQPRFSTRSTSASGTTPSPAGCR